MLFTFCVHRLADQSNRYSCDCEDDLEPRAGRCLLKLLGRRNYVNKVVFVIRYYGGIKLFNKRYELYEKVVNAALDFTIAVSSCTANTSQATATATCNNMFSFALPTVVAPNIRLGIMYSQENMMQLMIPKFNAGDPRTPTRQPNTGRQMINKPYVGMLQDLDGDQ